MPDYRGPRRPYDPWGRPLSPRQAGPQRIPVPNSTPAQPEPRRGAGTPDARSRAGEREQADAAERHRGAEYEAALAAERKRSAEAETALAAERQRAADLEQQLSSAGERTAQAEAALATEREQAAELRGKADSYLDLAQRTQADFVNYKRRAERERADEGQAARAELLVQVLPVLDDLERALEQLPEELRSHPWAEGMPLIARRLRMALAKAGLERLGAPGDEFDPRLHEAVAYEPRAGYAEGQIASVVRPGYRLGERVVRPAQVTVARGD